MGCQERFQGVTGEKPYQIGTGTGQKKPGGHREQVYEAVGVWQDKEGIAAEIEEKDFGVGELDYEAAQEGGPGIFTVRKASPIGFPGKVEDIGHCYIFDIRDVGGEGNPGCMAAVISAPVMKPHRSPNHIVIECLMPCWIEQDIAYRFAGPGV